MYGMGPKNCVAAGCNTKYGQGLLLKAVPSDPSLRLKWSQVVPLTKGRLPKFAAVCELHFSSDQFEKLRQDGRKKLKESAVPSIWKSGERSTLGDVTNKKSDSKAPRSNIHLNEHSYSSKISAKSPVQNLSPSTHLDQSLTMFIDPDMENLITEYSHELACTNKSAADANSSPSMPLDPCTFTTQVIENFIADNESARADESSANAYSSPMPLDQSLYAFTTPDVENLSANNSTESLLSDETSTTYDQHNSSCMATASVKERESNGLCLTPRSTAGYSVQKVESTVEAQRREILRLREENYKKGRALRLIQRALKTHQEIQRKYNVVRSSYSRLLAKHTACSQQQSASFQRLSTAQVHRLKGKSTKGTAWGPAEVRDGLALRMRCGTSGYSAFVQKYPILPSVRSLQRFLQFIDFGSGYFEEIFDLMEEASKNFSERDRTCGIVVDAMAIKPEERLDRSTGRLVGKATLPTHGGLADKALVIMLVGLFSRWKVIIGSYLLGKRFPEYATNDTGKAMADIIITGITKIEKVGYRVKTATGDMGPDNQAWWKHLGISAVREGEVVCCFPNPARPDDVVCVVPDGVHLFKSAKTMIEANKVIYLPPDVVSSENLPTNEVRYDHIEDLCKFEAECELKVAHRLDESNLHCKNHFNKMKVGSSRAVICHRTGVGLKRQADVQQKPALLTTAWFVMLLDAFFKIVTSRHQGAALSKKNPSAYQKALEIIEKVAHVFRHMHVGIGGNWKPSQRGILILCKSILLLQGHFLNEKGYIYFLLGHLTQDCLENLFSVLRLGQPLPNALIFKQHLKVLCLGMYHTFVKGSNYDFAEGEYLVDPLTIARRKAAERSARKSALSSEEKSTNPIPSLTQEDFEIISEWELAVIYDMAGSALHYLRKSLKTVCSTCYGALLWKKQEPHPYSSVVLMKEYFAFRSDEKQSEISQVLVSDDCFTAILTAEVAYRKSRDMLSSFRSADVIEHLVDSVMYMWDGCAIPNCHDICRKLLCSYLRARTDHYGKQMRARISVRESVDRSSRSVAMRQAVRNV